MSNLRARLGYTDVPTNVAPTQSLSRVAYNFQRDAKSTTKVDHKTIDDLAQDVENGVISIEWAWRQVNQANFAHFR